MGLLPIKQYPYKTLREKATKVSPSEIADPKFQKLLDDMMATLVKESPLGAGLAANQIGVLKRFFAVNVEIENDMYMRQVFINPEIVSTVKATGTDWEGCLSFVDVDGHPDQWGLVRRPTSVVIKALDRHGKPFEVKAADFYARLLLHENDHLNGVLFIDKLESDILNTDELDTLLRKQHHKEKHTAE